jgi:CheY-like chemotaxis protein
MNSRKGGAMNLKLNPFRQAPAKQNGLAPIQTTFTRDYVIPMPAHWEMSLANPVAESKSQSLTDSSGATPILMAEDNENSSILLKATLEKAGYAPVIARDGLEAMAALRRPDAPNIVVLDWKMPGMDGLDVCRRVRDLNKVVYVIFLTALATTENLVEALEAGADDYLTKPFKSAELIARIHVGLRVVKLQNALGDHVKELEKALIEIKVLRSQLTIPL